MDGVLLKFAITVGLSMTLCACGGETARSNQVIDRAVDPVVARALSDPLMTDPDLASRNQANAALAMSSDPLLPVFDASETLIENAEIAVERALLAGGSIAELPMASDLTAPDLSVFRYAGDMVEALEGPRACAAQLEDGLNWSLKLPEFAAIAPHGMVRQAAGTDDLCTLRVVRYRTPANPESILRFYFTKAERAGYGPALANGSKTVVGNLAGAQLYVQTSEAPNGMTAVDIVYWES